MKSKRIVFLCLSLLLVCLSTSFALNTDEVQETVVKLSDHVYRVTLDYQLRPNIGISIGPNGILLVDTGHEKVAAKLLSVVKNLGKGDVTYIINTHSHGDHAGGNRVCGEKAAVIGHTDINNYVSSGVLVKGDEKIQGKSGRNFEIYYSLRFNGEEIWIIPSPGVHSDNDLIIWFKDSAVVHMGDLLLTQSFPAVGPRVKEYLEILDTAIDVFPENTMFIGGHGRDYTLKDMRDYRKMLQTTIDIVKKEMDAGKSMEEIQEAKVLQDWDSWGEFLTFLNPDSWTEYIFLSFLDQEGEFTNYEEMRQHIGEIYQQEKYQEAADLLERALDQFPDYILANSYNLSLMYTHLGEYSKSAQALLHGLEHEIFYSNYAFGSEIWAPLRETDAFKKFELQNESKRIEAQKKAKPAILVIKPEGFSASKKYPLFIALHGGGGNIAGFKDNWTSSKLKKDFITAYLQSSQVVAMDGYSWTEDIELTKKEIEVAYKKIVKDYPIDTQNVLIGGFSSGGVAALEMILDSTIPASGFVVLCPARSEGFSFDRVKLCKKRGVRGTLLTTEMDPRLSDQKKMAEVFKTEEFPLQFVVTPNIGHWFPEDMDKQIDLAIDFIQRKER